MSVQTCDPKATQMDFVHNRQSTTSDLTECDEDELAYDSGSPSPAPRGADRRAEVLTPPHNPAVSSSARIELLPRGRPLYSIPQAILRTHFKCSAPTIDRVANSYAEKDDVTKDQEILTGDPDYTAARKALLDAKYRAENPASVANKEYDSDDTRSKRQGRRVTKARDTPGNTPKAQSLYHLRVSGSPAKSLSNPVKCAASSVCTTPDPPAVHAMSEARFLLPFVTKIPLDAAAAWHIELERKKFTQAKLRAMAKIAATDVDQLIAKLLPQMDEIDRFLLVSAIKALNPTV